jgi:hypothetical protein
MILAAEYNDDYNANMITFIFSLLLTFSLILAPALLISYCKRRQARTSHGLTGMCHKSGGTMGSCCSAKLFEGKGSGCTFKSSK